MGRQAIKRWGLSIRLAVKRMEQIVIISIRIPGGHEKKERERMIQLKKKKKKKRRIFYGFWH
jgi:hypothetical protein